MSCIGTIQTGTLGSVQQLYGYAEAAAGGRFGNWEKVCRQVSLQPDQLAEIDAWVAAQDDPPNQPEAIRQLVAAGPKSTVLK